MRGWLRDKNDTDAPGALQRATRFGRSLNLTFRRYNLLNSSRQIHFLAQVLGECGLAATRESYRGTGREYEAFYGRGIMQVTWPANFDAYGAFRRLPNVTASYRYHDYQRITHTSLHVWAHGDAARQWFPRFDPDVLADDALAQTDSGGFYWIDKPLGGTQVNLSRVADHGLTRQAIGEMSFLVNGGFNGFESRQVYAAFMKRLRGDATEASRHEAITFEFRNTYDRHHGLSQHAFTIDYTPQRP